MKMEELLASGIHLPILVNSFFCSCFFLSSIFCSCFFLLLIFVILVAAKGLCLHNHFQLAECVKGSRRVAVKHIFWHDFCWVLWGLRNSIILERGIWIQQKLLHRSNLSPGNGCYTRRVSSQVFFSLHGVYKSCGLLDLIRPR